MSLRGNRKSACSFLRGPRKLAVRRCRVEHLEERAVLSAGIVTTSIGGAMDQGFASVVTSDNKVLVVGKATAFSEDSDFALMRYNGDGTLDTSFGNQGIVTTAISPSMSDALTAVALDPSSTSGRFLVGGIVHTYTRGRPGSDFVVARYNVNGTLDTTFGRQGKVQTDVGPTDRLNGIAVLKDGRVVVVGSAGAVGPGFRTTVLVYTTTGQLDRKFNGTGFAQKDLTGFSYNEGNAVALQMVDGEQRILVAGYAYSGAGNSALLLRYKLSGQLDTAFDSDGIVTSAFGGEARLNAVGIQTVRVEQNGAAVNVEKIVAVGEHYPSGALRNFLVCRFNADGTVDSTFNKNGSNFFSTDFGGDDIASSLAIQPDGKIVAAGNVYTTFTEGVYPNEVRYEVRKFALARYSNGDLDANFGRGGIVVTPIMDPTYDWSRASSVVVLSGEQDFQVVASGSTRTKIAVVYYPSSGALDPLVGVSATGFALTSTATGAKSSSQQALSELSAAEQLSRWRRSGSNADENESIALTDCALFDWHIS